ncbi:MAG TPA: AI-2E family transporter [Candidatus Baltobacteraceae bacterium]|nr:AI-2E family transporter [Candidatus Baltobacteraceae bacterium]
MNMILPIIALSIGYAILTWPLVRRLERYIARGAAIALIDAGIALALAAIGYALAPLMYVQAQASIAALSHIGTGFLARFDVNLAGYAGQALQAGVALARSAVSLAAMAFIVPVLAAYFQLDAPRYERALLALLPKRYHSDARDAVSDISAVVGRFVRGQVIVSAIVGLLVYGVLRATGVPYSAVIALATAILDLVPYLGGIAAFVPSLLFALAYGGIGHAVLVGVLLAAVFELEAQVLSPQIIGSNTGLPPSVIVMTLLAGSALFGVPGLYIAVPGAAAAGVVLRVILREKRGISSPFLPSRGVGSGHAHHRR